MTRRATLINDARNFSIPGDRVSNVVGIGRCTDSQNDGDEECRALHKPLTTRYRYHYIKTDAADRTDCLFIVRRLCLRRVQTTPDPSKDPVYFCPMDRDVRSNTPGNCSRCGMKL